MTATSENYCLLGERLRGLLVVVSGPAGSGKTTIADELLRTAPEWLGRVVTATTRAPRAGEKDGEDYIFLTPEVFQEKLKNHEFIEYNIFNYNYYGTLREELDKQLASKKVVVLVIDVNGAEQVARRCPEAVRLFVLPPTKAVLRERLKARGTESDEDISKRLLIAENEIVRLETYDYLVVNDNFESAVADTRNIIRAAQYHHIRGGELELWQQGGYAGWHQPKEFPPR